MKLKITVHGVAYEVDVEVLDAKDEMDTAGASPLPPAAGAPAVAAPGPGAGGPGRPGAGRSAPATAPAAWPAPSPAPCWRCAARPATASPPGRTSW